MISRVMLTAMTDANAAAQSSAWRVFELALAIEEAHQREGNKGYERRDTEQHVHRPSLRSKSAINLLAETNCSQTATNSPSQSRLH